MSQIHYSYYHNCNSTSSVIYLYSYLYYFHISTLGRDHYSIKDNQIKGSYEHFLVKYRYRCGASRVSFLACLRFEHLETFLFRALSASATPIGASVAWPHPAPMVPPRHSLTTTSIKANPMPIGPMPCHRRNNDRSAQHSDHNYYQVVYI